jgi:drug/metabolite transporter (DMT)-like permease
MFRFNPMQLSGLVVLAIGLLLLAFAHFGAVDPMIELSTSLTGQDTGRALWLVGTGAAAALAGALLMASGPAPTGGRIQPPADTMPP